MLLVGGERRDQPSIFWSDFVVLSIVYRRDAVKTRLKILPVLIREHYTSLLHWV
jgi:hypothetical protein